MHILNFALYPELAQIYDRIIKNKSLRIEELEPYIDVFFPVPKGNGSNYYVCLPGVAIFSNRSDLFKDLMKNPKFNPMMYEVTNSATLLWLSVAVYKQSPSERGSKILNGLLEHPSVDKNMGRFSLHESPLQHLAAEGDKYLPLMQDLIAKGCRLTQDICNSSPLSIAIQEEQYATAMMLLQTDEGKTLARQYRADGSSVLDLACEFSTDIEKGKALIAKLLELVNIHECESRPCMYSAIGNDQCGVDLLKFLLEQGANPNQHSMNESILLEVARIFMAQMEIKNIKAAQQMRQMFVLLLEYNADIFVQVQYGNVDFITFLVLEGKRGVLLLHMIKQHFKDQPETLKLIDHTIAAAEKIDPNSEMMKEKDVTKQNIRNVETETLRANAGTDDDSDHHLKIYLRELKAMDPNPRDRSMRMFRSSLILKLLNKYALGMLPPSNILDLIEIFKKDDEYKHLIIYLYREYIRKGIENFTDNQPNKLSYIEDLFKNLVLFSKEASKTEGMNAAKHYSEYNLLFIRLMQLALLHNVQSINHLNEINKCNGEMLILQDRLPEFVLLQFKLVYAYKTNDKSTYDVLYEQMKKMMPQNHVAHRQYQYWADNLLFQAAKHYSDDQIDKQLIEEMTLKIGKLRALNVPQNHLNELMNILNTIKDLYIQKEKKISAERKNKNVTSSKVSASSSSNVQPIKATAETTAPTQNTIMSVPPAEVPKPTPNPASSSSSSSSSSSCTAEASNAAFFRELPFHVKKEREEKQEYAQQQHHVLSEAITRLRNKIKGQMTSESIYKEQEVRTLFQSYLLPGEQIKPLVAYDRNDLVWAVCRVPEKTNQELVDEFHTQFKHMTKLEQENGVPRLKIHKQELGDYRLHGHIVRAIGHRCTLVVYDTVWTHSANKPISREKDEYVHVDQKKPAPSSASSELKPEPKAGPKK